MLFPTRIGNFETKKTRVGWAGGALIQLFNAKISPNIVIFNSIKEKKVKYILTS